ncbi:MAG: hypothetical protein PSX81_03240 [bacterium]|nr:hypothetical protein [bacterium]
MTIQNEQTIITTRASIKLIVLGLLCGVLFGCFADIFILSSPKLFQLNAIHKNWLCFTIGFTTSCLCILPLKIISLTKTTLVISRPLVFMEKVIPLEQIIGIKEQIYSIHTAGASNFGIISALYFGNQMKIEMSNTKIIRINSFDIGDYEKLCPLLMQSKGLKAKMGQIPPRFYREYHWLIGMFILAIILVIVLFKFNEPT